MPAQLEMDFDDLTRRADGFVLSIACSWGGFDGQNGRKTIRRVESFVLDAVTSIVECRDNDLRRFDIVFDAVVS